MKSKWQQGGLIALGCGARRHDQSELLRGRAAGQPGPLPVEELRAFTEVFGRVKSDYVEPVEDKKLINEAINGMLSGLDPHSSYLDAEAFKELQVGTQGEFGGLGIEVGMEDGFVKVISPIEDTPAYLAGIKSGDLIIKLDDSSVKGMSLNDAVKRMRGKPNTSITLTVVRKGETKPLTFTLNRAVIKIQSVKSKLVEPGFGYFRVTQFQEHTAETLAKAIEKVIKENNGPLRGLILDLRNDPGGSAERRRRRVRDVSAAELARGLYRRPHRRLEDAVDGEPGELSAWQPAGRLRQKAARRRSRRYPWSCS